MHHGEGNVAQEELSKAKAVAQVPPPTIQTKVKTKDSFDVTLVCDDEYPRLRLTNTQFKPDNPEHL